MKTSSLGFYGLLILFLSVGCAQLPHSRDFAAKETLLVHAQNRLGLQVKATGCSLGNLGGIHLMTEHAKAHPADLNLEIVPAFHPFLSGPFSKEELIRERKKVWEGFQEQGVGIYSVDAKDLEPSLSDFVASAKDTKAVLLSTNLVDSKNGETLFAPFFILKFSGKTIAIVSLTEPSDFSRADWIVIDPLLSFSEVQKTFPEPVDLIYVLGSLDIQTRKTLSRASKLSVLFLGGAAQERNTTQLEPLDKGNYYGLTPSYGTGFSEMLLGTNEKEFSQKRSVRRLGGIYHSFYSDLLDEKKKAGAQCSPPSPGK